VQRSFTRKVWIAAAAAALALSAGVDHASAKSIASVRTVFENTGVDPDAAGAVRAVFRTHKSKLTIRVSGLAPGQYQIVSAGIIEETFAVDEDGRADVRLRTGDDLALDFDPRGQALEISDGTDVVLATVLTADGSGDDGDGSRSRMRVFLKPTEAWTGGSARADFELRDDRMKFKVELENVPAGAYDLFVADIKRGTITVGPFGEAEIEFATNDDDGDELPLTFDPRGQVIEIAQGGVVLFSGSLEVTSEGLDVCQERETRVALPSTGVDPDADGKVRYRVDEDCDRDFNVEIEDVPVGVYDLVVGGVVAGQIHVVSTGDGVEGEIEFESGDDDDDDLPLTIDPVGKLIEVVQGEVVFFSGIFDGTTTTPNTCQEVDVQKDLTVHDIAGDGDGKVRFRMDEDCDADLKIEIEDVPSGSYEVVIGAAVRGTITVGDEEGEIEFDSDPDDAGDVPLNFDPSGQLIQIRRNGSVYFSAQLP